jgi:hypothetical protein
MRRRRPVVQYASMTSLADVMFILVFASLIYSAGLERRAAQAEAAPPEPVMGVAEAAASAAIAAAREAEDPSVRASREAEELRQAALAQLMTGLEGRGPVVVRVGRDGQLRALEHRRAGRVTSIPLGLPLVERVPDPDVALSYLGDRQDGLRLCSLLRLHLGATDLSDALVIVAPDVPVDQLSVALARGLQRDTERCLSDQRGVAVIVDPGARQAPIPSQKEGGVP